MHLNVMWENVELATEMSATKKRKKPAECSVECALRNELKDYNWFDEAKSVRKMLIPAISLHLSNANGSGETVVKLSTRKALGFELISLRDTLGYEDVPEETAQIVAVDAEFEIDEEIEMCEFMKDLSKLRKITFETVDKNVTMRVMVCKDTVGRRAFKRQACLLPKGNNTFSDSYKYDEDGNVMEYDIGPLPSACTITCNNYRWTLSLCLQV